MLTKSSAEKALPHLQEPSTEIEEDNRLKLRIDSVDPNDTKSSIDMEAPIRQALKTEKEAPKRDVDRIERLEAPFVKS
jgi:hypothetical protein